VHTPFDVVPPARVLIVDEAQDLSPLQWDMVHKIANVAEEVYIAGDDDQAIFRWAGADIDHLIELPGNRRILNKSWRCPGVIQRLASEVAARISKRVAKEWEPRDVLGQLEWATGLEHIDMSSGTWLLLARNGYLLDDYVQHCLQQGYVFDSANGSPIRGAAFSAIKTWEELRAGKEVAAKYVKHVYDHMSIRKGVMYGFKKQMDDQPDNRMLDMKSLVNDFGLCTDKIWHEALDKLLPVEVEYFIAALKRGEKLLREPRIKISTIHSVKGGEAENVVLQVDMAERTWREFQSSPDDEHRVWYVAITRAKERLFVLQPKTNRSYTL